MGGGCACLIWERGPNMEGARACMQKKAKAWARACVNVCEGVGVVHGWGVAAWCECC